MLYYFKTILQNLLYFQGSRALFVLNIDYTRTDWSDFELHHLHEHHHLRNFWGQLFAFRMCTHIYCIWDFSLFRSINLFDASPVWWDVKWTDGQPKSFQSTFSRFQSNLDTCYKQAQQLYRKLLQFNSDQPIGYLEAWLAHT